MSSEGGGIRLTTVPGLVYAQFGVKITAAPPSRYRHGGWEYEGATDVECSNPRCSSDYVVYRKPYSTTQGDYRYWALVCLECREVSALSDQEPPTQKLLRAWAMNGDDATDQELAEPDQLPEQAPGLPGPEVDDSQGTSSTAPRPSGADASARTPAASISENAAERPSHRTPDPVVLAAARAELEASRGQIRVVDVGLAVAVAESVYAVRGPSIDLSENPSGELFLAASRQDADRVRVTKVQRVSKEEVVVETSEAVARSSAVHLFHQVDPTVVAEAFVRFLETEPAPGIASALLGATGLQPCPAVAVASLNPEQEAAAGVIVGSGLGAVWGPPGTGKTRVIGESIALLLRRGQTVALVSNTNVAVDQALLHVCRASSDSPPGEILRLGYASLPEVVAHPHLTLSKAVAAQNHELVSSIENLLLRLSSERVDPVLAQLAALDAVVGARDASALEALVLHRDNLRRSEELADLLKATKERRLALGEAERTAAMAFDAARRAWVRWSAYEDIPGVERRATAVAMDIKTLRTELVALDAQVETARSGPRFSRRQKTRALAATRVRLSTELGRLEASHLADLERLTNAARLGATATKVVDAHLRLTTTKGAWQEAQAAWLGIERELAALDVEVSALGPVEPLDEVEKELLDVIDASGSVSAFLEHRGRIDADARAVRDRIVELSEQIDALQRRLDHLAETVVKDARVIGTTVAQLVLNRALIERRFDHVIIDEASTALPPYAYSALTKADLGGALVGDFEQNTPISQTKPGNTTGPESDWLERHPFALLGIADASSARSTPGCVTLRTQYRFGRQTTRLANAVAYDGVLLVGREAQPPHPEIVLVDTASMGDAATIARGRGGRGRWWAAGAAISVALARNHDSADVGVVTPFKAQVQMTRAAFMDADAAATPVGTSHSFQGSEFPVVILDLVEDGDGRSWVARADRKGSAWARSGNRVFNVGITRSRERLYLLLNVGTVRAARSGPLRALGDLVDAGEVEIRDALEVLGGVANSGPSTGVSPSVTSLFGAPRMCAPMMLSHDDFYESLQNDLQVAARRVAIFSPFVAAGRLDGLVPHLAALASSGVRVTAITKSADELTHPGLLAVMRRQGIRVREVRNMHHKVVMIDDHITYVGSLNVLSNTGRTGEIMLRFEGPELTDQVFRWMKDALRTPGR